MAERTDHDTSNCDAERKLTSELRVKLPDSVRDNVRMLRRLQHLLVDMTADAGFLKTLEGGAEMCLEVLSSNMASHYVIDLLGQAHFPRKRSKKAKKSKKTAKRGSK